MRSMRRSSHLLWNSRSSFANAAFRLSRTRIVRILFSLFLYARRLAVHAVVSAILFLGIGRFGLLLARRLGPKLVSKFSYTVA